MIYQKIIIQVTGCRPEEAHEIEEIMRGESPTLNGLHEVDFDDLARTAYEVLKLEREADKR